jgi:DNA relaxase NicK
MIGRLKEMLERAETATEEDKAQIMQDFNTEVARARENFEYNMRDVMDSARIEVNNLIERYGFSSDKLQNNLERVTYDVLMKREQVIAQYTQNTRAQIQIANDQLNVLQNYDNFL